MREVKRIHISEIQEVLSPKLVVVDKKVYIIKEDLRYLPEFITLIEIPKLEENRKEV